MSDIGVEQVLAQMRAISATTRMPTQVDETSAGAKPDFSKLMTDAINQVNNAQQDAKELKTSFELGEKGVDLPEVMVAVQKASVSFQAITQVRNKLLSAYQEVMNMQV